MKFRVKILVELLLLAMLHLGRYAPSLSFTENPAGGEELEAAFTRLPRFEWENDPEQGVTSGPVLVAGNQYQQSQDDTSQQS